MFKRKGLLSVCICLLVINIFAGNVFCADLKLGESIDSYMGVVAKSNGGDYDSFYQCVEYVRRFYYIFFKMNLYSIRVGVARNYYLAFGSLNFAQFGLERYDNNGYVPPKPTDILVFNNSNNVGHVAIITNVTATTVSIIEQNWSRNKCKRDLPLTIVNGKYFIGTVLDYPVLGWLGLPRDSNVFPSPTCRWDFNTTGWDEDWTRTRIDGYSVGGGIYYINPSASDPNITSPPISISAAKSALVISMASNAPDGVGAIYFTTDTDQNWNEAKKEDFTIINDGKYHKYCILMNSATWKGIITRIRIDPADEGISYTNKDTIGIDFISLSQPDWDFDNAGNTDGWTMANIETYSVFSSVFYPNPSSLDPYIISSVISKNANDFDSIYIRMGSNAPDGKGAIYFITDISPNWSEDKKVEFDIINDGEFYRYFISMKEHCDWQGTITQIRIDIADRGIKNSRADMVGIGCIHIY